MVRNTYIISWIFMLSVIFGSCSENDMTVPETAPVCDIVFNVSVPNGMRMANDVVQTDGQFRGLQKLWVIPFQTTGDVTVSDFPLISTVIGSTSDKVDNRNYYYMSGYSMTIGTNHVLAYARAIPVTGDSKNGKLETNLVNRQDLSNMKFNLSSIQPTNDIHEDAQALATYLTTIATTTGWSTTTDETLHQLYLDFIKANPYGTGLLAGSAAYVKEHVKKLKNQLDGRTDDLSEAIKENIGDIDNVACMQNQYPSSLGLPDGAAALRWTGTGMGNQFSVRTKTTTLDNINNVTRYAYPAELWYHVNSTIKTSAQEVEKSSYENYSKWQELLDDRYKEGTAVTSVTKSVAVNNPLQYGVCHLQITLKAMTGALKDAADKYIECTGTPAVNLPMKALIIGGQHPVGFDFKPLEPKSDLETRFIYDTEVGTTGTGQDETVNTLALQSYDNETVPVVVEFLNNTGHSFTGKDGIIYPGTKFYLVAMLDPAKGTGGDDKSVGHVFTQDYTTTVTMKINSLANAYTCIPDLLEPRLEIGVQVVTQWIQSTTTTVKL